MASLNDPELVRSEYASERGLLGRRAGYRETTGPDAPQVLFETIAALGPSRVLEVGCGPGELAARLRQELGAEVLAVDSSPRMVELARARGVDARVGDVQALTFEDASFDVAVAAWMLYHVPDVERALAELARVLRPGGRLVAVLNGADHLSELKALVGATGTRFLPAEDAPLLLRRHFASVETIDVSGTAVFRDRASLVAFVESFRGLLPESGELPEVPLPFVVSRRPVIFVATRS